MDNKIIVTINVNIRNQKEPEYFECELEPTDLLGLAMRKIKNSSKEDIVGFYGGEIYIQNNIKL